MWYCRLEQEEQARQKLQLEKVTADTKLKKFEEELAQHETITAKVCLQMFVLFAWFLSHVSLLMHDTDIAILSVCPSVCP